MDYIFLLLPVSKKPFGAHFVMFFNAEDAPLLRRSSERQPDE